MMRRALIGLLALTACAGPASPLEVGSKAIPADVTLGDTALPPRPTGQNPGSFGFPGFIQPPIPRPRPGVSPPIPRAKACPIANPLDASLLVARAEAPLAPAPATYTFRNDGAFTLDGVTMDYPRTTERAISAARALPGDTYEFDVTIGLAGETTTTTYRVVNDVESLERGIFIARVATERADGADSFVPDRPIMLMPFPPPELGTNLEDELAAIIGDSYRSSGTDPLTQTTMLLEARITGKTRVDACGEWIDAFDIEVVTGRIIGPSKQIAFAGSYAVAPQYGGLVVEDDIDMTGTQDFVEVASDLRARINRVPRAPLAL